MTQDELKQAVAKASLAYVEDDTIVGVGTGSTVNYFIDYLATIKHRIEGAVASSNATRDKLKSLQIPVLDLNSVSDIAVYIDGADECSPHRQLIKDGGGALTQEKIVAQVAKRFVCIIDDTKQVNVLGKYPLPVEVIPCARSYVARELVKLGGDPVYRSQFITDNGNIILDVHNLEIVDPIALETQINNIVGVVCNGLFGKRRADIVLISHATGSVTVQE